MNHHPSCTPERDVVFMRLCEQCGERESADFEVDELQKQLSAAKSEIEELKLNHESWQRLSDETIESLKASLAALQVQLDLISGELCDAATVKVDPLYLGVRALVKERDRLLGMLAKVQGRVCVNERTDFPGERDSCSDWYTDGVCSHTIEALKAALDEGKKEI